MVGLICLRGGQLIVRPWYDSWAAHLNGRAPSGCKERSAKPRTGSMPVVLRKILGHQAPQENRELIPASKEIAFRTANFMPAPAWQELRTIPDLRRL
jgi:hypothetical protein